MERARILRFLRFAVTALSLTACVLLIALWVRSYWWSDGFACANSWYVVSLRGELLVCVLDNNNGFFTIPGDHWVAKIDDGFNASNFYDASTPTWNVFFARGATLPGWLQFVAVKLLTILIIPFAIALSTRPWIHWSKRFRLRTLLIAITLVAVLLGILVWSR